jgi:hypothetical protein
MVRPLQDIGAPGVSSHREIAPGSSRRWCAATLELQAARHGGAIKKIHAGIANPGTQPAKKIAVNATKNKGDLMRTWLLTCSAAVLALGLSAAPAHADEWNKLTYLTFSAPVALPGIALPAGTYRFELMDPDTSRRVIRVSDKDGSKQYGIFLSISDRKLEPSDTPVVMFREMPAGLPQAVRAWFYPGETYGYEFVYPHDQAEKIAKATHQSVLAMNEPSSSTTEADRVASMRGAEVGRIDENGKPVSSDEQLKDSSAQHPAATTTASSAASSTTSSGAAANTAPASTNPAASTTTAASNTASSPSNATAATSGSASPSSSSARRNTTTARSNTARNSTTASSSANDRQTANSGAVGTSGRASSRRLPRTASPMPFVALLSLLAFGGAAGVRVARKALA